MWDWGFSTFAYMLLYFLVISKNGISAYIKERGEFISIPVLQSPVFQMFMHKCDVLSLSVTAWEVKLWTERKYLRKEVFLW